MWRRVNRRQFLQGLAASLSTVLLGHCRRSEPASMPTGQIASPMPTPTPTYIPCPVSTEEPTPTLTPNSPTPKLTPMPTQEPPTRTSRQVVHVRAPEATFWDFGDDYYGNFVDQAVVNEMLDQGVMNLAGTSSATQAWQSLIPDYAPGKAIAIKVNFNNAHSCEETDTNIDALIHPVNAIVGGLKQMGVAEADIWVYDATRLIPSRFVDGCLYPGIQYFGTGCQNRATFNSDDPDATVVFSSPGAVNQKITDVLVNATYLINIPIMKKHGGAGITLSFKNHLGSIPHPNRLHAYLGPGAPHYTPGHNPMVDIHSNPHVGPKTRLVVGEGLFGNRRTNTSSPEPWSTFGGAPNSLFFAVDPVAIDCVMCDFLEAESGTTREGADVYLQIAEEAGLGTYERGAPWGSGYSQIDYTRIEL